MYIVAKLIKKRNFAKIKTYKLMTTDEKYMMRCIQLAKNGQQNAQPNPMVGAVIVCPPTPGCPEGRIIGEGYHIRCGEGHAEVNACASVRPEDEHLLKECTIYVSLEPCSHHGKTPPCADLLVGKGFRRCVIGCQDPFAKVQGRGIQKLRDAGMEVTVGVLEDECKALNKRFFTFHSMQRPFVTLKWAQSADGFIDGHISTPYTQMVCHRRRAEHQAILVGRRTYETDNPSLNTREWYGKDPKKYIVSNDPCFEINPDSGFTRLVGNVPAMLRKLHEDGIQTLLVEGGSKLHQSFIDSGLWDECYIETGNEAIHGSVSAPVLKDAILVEREEYMGRIIEKYVKATI